MEANGSLVEVSDTVGLVACCDEMELVGCCVPEENRSPLAAGAVCCVLEANGSLLGATFGEGLMDCCALEENGSFCEATDDMVAELVVSCTGEETGALVTITDEVGDSTVCPAFKANMSLDTDVAVGACCGKEAKGSLVVAAEIEAGVLDCRAPGENGSLGADAKDIALGLVICSGLLGPGASHAESKDVAPSKCENISML